MARYKSVYDEKTKTISQKPVDTGAFLEVLEKDFREGRIEKDAYTKKKSELEKVISESLQADKKDLSAKIASQAKVQESLIKGQSDKRASRLAASKFRSAEKAKRKEASIGKGDK